MAMCVYKGFIYGVKIRCRDYDTKKCHLYIGYKLVYTNLFCLGSFICLLSSFLSFFHTVCFLIRFEKCLDLSFVAIGYEPVEIRSILPPIRD